MAENKVSDYKGMFALIKENTPLFGTVQFKLKIKAHNEDKMAASI